MDMLIKLFEQLPRSTNAFRPGIEGVTVRRAMAYERSKVVQWVLETFNLGWADECEAAFGHHPIGCYIAIYKHNICGFCCLNTTFRNFIGPIGVSTTQRRKGIGKELILAALCHLLNEGYAYAIVGDAGQPDFFKAVAGAIEIPDSTPGPYPERISFVLK